MAIFPESSCLIGPVYKKPSSIGYVLTWIAILMLDKEPYIEKLGKTKFWIIMGAAMAYFSSHFFFSLLAFLRHQKIQMRETNILIFSLSDIFTGVLFSDLHFYR